MGLSPGAWGAPKRGMPTGSEAFLELPIVLGYGPATGPTLNTALCHIRTLVGRRINTARPRLFSWAVWHSCRMGARNQEQTRGRIGPQLRLGNLRVGELHFCPLCTALDQASSLSRKLAYVPGPTFGFVKLLASSGSHCTKWADEQHWQAGFESRLVPDFPLPFIPTLIGLRAFDLVSSRVWWEAATNIYMARPGEALLCPVVGRSRPAVVGCCTVRSGVFHHWIHHLWPQGAIPPGFNPLRRGWVYRPAPEAPRKGECRRGPRHFWNCLSRWATALRQDPP